MPRGKRNYTNRKTESILKRDTSINSTIMDMSSKILDKGHVKLVIWKADIKDRMKSASKKLNVMEKEKLEMYEQEFRRSLMTIPKSVLNTVIDINSDIFRSAILGVEDDEDEVDDEVDVKSPSPEAPRTIRRRSRSVSNVKIGTRTSQRLQRIRSTSVDIYKTPNGKMRLSSIMSHKKYTVMKPRKPENSGVHVRRIMKPDEEAISTCGSPLYVASCNLGAPHVNIPLPGGVVLNIEPKLPKGPLEIPGLDAKTKNQIKILCEHLKKLV